MSQYKNHPFVVALEALCPIILPSFTLRSARDGEPTPEAYPLVDYIIVEGQTKTYNPGTRKWRGNFLVVLDILFKETEDPNSWCQYDELKEAKDRQALFWYLEQI